MNANIERKKKQKKTNVLTAITASMQMYKLVHCIWTQCRPV